jgi:predicted GNAT family acetyltransferase
MIRLLTEADRAAVIALLQQAPALNLYMLGNLEQLGFQHELSQFWGDFADEGGESGQLRGILNRYMTGWDVYGLPTADWAALAQVIDMHPIQAVRLQDNPGGVPSILPYLKRYHAAQSGVETLMALTPDQFVPSPVPPGITVRRATMDDLPALVAFYARAENMTRTAPAVERPLRDTRLWMAMAGEEILSTALTNAETQDFAMIGGVFTKPSARKRGLSRAVCGALCPDLITSQRQPILYWRNPLAGSVYRQLGFQKIGQWRAVWLEGAASS